MSERAVVNEREIVNVAVFSHANPEETEQALVTAREEAEAAGCVLYADAEELEKHGAGGEGIRPLEDLDGEPDLCLALGGDGTILRALRHFAGTSVAVFGVNYGTIGFLAAAEAGDLGPALRRAFAADFEVIPLPGLEAGARDEGRRGLNDISFTRRPHHRVAELSYRLGGREVGHVRCDGLVAATPVGSTGYNLANGGPILAWGVEGYVVSFIAPHTLTARALVVAPADVLRVINVADRDPVDIATDGVPAGSLEPGEEIDVRFRDDVASLAQLEGETFYRRIREKFGRLAH
jgi:NAD+ kinase